MRATATTAALLAMLALTVTVRAQPSASTYRMAFSCPERGPATSVCVAGTIAPGTQVTLVTKDQATPARVKERFEDATLWERLHTFTRVEGSRMLPERTFVIAALVPADAIKVVPQAEIRDAAIVERLTQHVAKDLENYTTWCIDLAEKCGLRTKLARLSPSIVIAEVEYASDHNIFFQRAFLVGQQIVDLHPRVLDAHDVDRNCAHLDLAFSVSGRLHVATGEQTCEGDAGGELLILDLSGPKPKLLSSW